MHSCEKEVQSMEKSNYKDSMFRMLYLDKRELLSLYNAVNGTDYADEDSLEINTLQNAIYMKMKNDVSFLFNFQVNLYEHQSTVNPNMPLRDLFYVSKEYEKMVVTKTLYSRTKVSIPTPHFIVFYNGMEQQPEREILKLSDLYQLHEEEPMLELQVEMLNINDGNNEELKECCQTLKEYMQYVNCVRYYIYEKKLTLNDAVENAVTECIRNGILSEFLNPKL